MSNCDICNSGNSKLNSSFDISNLRFSCENPNLILIHTQLLTLIRFFFFCVCSSRCNHSKIFRPLVLYFTQTKNMKKQLSADHSKTLLKKLQERFEKNKNRHPKTKWEEIESKLKANPDKLWSLNEMEISGGEPDVVEFENSESDFTFVDCSAESPKGRRSLCYDQEALEARKKFKPENSAVTVANEMGIELLTEAEYIYFQKFGPFDTKTSSWLKTPKEVREKGGAIFGDHRFGRTFIYHNGAESYYGARGFRGKLVL